MKESTSPWFMWNIILQHKGVFKERDVKASCRDVTPDSCMKISTNFAWGQMKLIHNNRDMSVG